MSKKQEAYRYIAKSLDQLKDFQRATMDVCYDWLFKEGRSRMLVADEVGLGKTFLAGELLREAIVERRQRVLLVAEKAVKAHRVVDFGRAEVEEVGDFADRFRVIRFEFSVARWPGSANRPDISEPAQSHRQA